MVGKRVAVIPEFVGWFSRLHKAVINFSELTVQHVNTTLTGHTVNLETDKGHVIYHVPEELAFDMRREYMRMEGEG